MIESILMLVGSTYRCDFPLAESKLSWAGVTTFAGDYPGWIMSSKYRRAAMKC